MQAYIVVHNLNEKKFGCHSGSVLQWYIHLYWLTVLRKDEQRILYSGSGDVPSAEIVPFSGGSGSPPIAWFLVSQEFIPQPAP